MMLGAEQSKPRKLPTHAQLPSPVIESRHVPRPVHGMLPPGHAVNAAQRLSEERKHVVNAHASKLVPRTTPRTDCSSPLPRQCRKRNFRTHCTRHDLPSNKHQYKKPREQTGAGDVSAAERARRVRVVIRCEASAAGRARERCDARKDVANTGARRRT